MALVAVDAATHTLDIKEAQILIHFPDDVNAMYWHHRVALKKIGGGRWVCFTPDHELCVHDLSTMRHIVLERAGRFPQAEEPFVYAFDPVTRAEIEGAKRRASTMAALLDDNDDVEEIEQLRWFFAEVGREDFGSSVSVADASHGVMAETKGVVTVEGIEVFVERMPISKREDWMRSRKADSEDIRLLGNFRDSSGKRHLTLADALGRMRDSVMEDWNLLGPRVVKEWLTNVRNGPGDLVTYHHTFMQRSGLPLQSNIAHDHRILTEVLRIAIDVDQLDVSNLLCFEQIVRRLVQEETAVARDPLRPDFSGLDIVMSQPTNSIGGAQTAQFTEWVTNRLKEQANIWKQTRLFSNEQRTRRGRGSSWVGGDDDDDDEFGGRGRGKGRGPKRSPGGKAKAGRGRGTETASAGAG